MGKARRKKGKNARRSKQGQIGLLKTIPNSVENGQFTKKKQHREVKKDKKKDLEKVGELVREKLGTGGKDAEKTPYVYVIHTGSVGKYVRRLERDIRRVVQPYTSMDLRVTKKNNFKDFLVNSQFLGVSHLVVLTRTEKSLNLRIIRNSQGPTVHFRIESYSLCRSIQSVQKRPINFKEMFLNPPLVILNGFSQSSGKHLSLVQSTIQHMFPTIDIDKVKLKSIRRALLASYDNENDVIEFRHYAIKAIPTGLSKSTKKLMQNKIPDLSKYKDFSEFLLNPGALSESENELECPEVKLSQEVNSRGLTEGQTTKLRLVEIGPRMTWKLIKIEEGVNDGEVLYHSFIQKTNKEIIQLRKKAPLSRKRKLLHEKNVEHSVIEKLSAQAKKVAKEEEKFESEKAKLIQKQADVTGEPIEERKVVSTKDETEKDAKEKKGTEKQPFKKSKYPSVKGQTRSVRRKAFEAQGSKKRIVKRIHKKK